MKSIIHRKRETCRLCGSKNLHPFLSLGPIPLANAFLKSPQEFDGEPVYPLDACFCADCTLVQLSDVIAPEVLFRHYHYVTGTSDSIAAHNIEYAAAMVNRLALQDDELVVEIASNDGSLLKCFKPYGVRVLGVEPATNIAAIARKAGIETVNQFFNTARASMLLREYGSARAVIGNNVLAHVDDPKDFLTGCKHILAPDGLISIEVPYLDDLLARLEYDTIYHEHLSYFSVRALMRLCEQVGLVIAGIERVPVHGGSLRMLAGHREHFREHAASVLRVVEEESERGLDKFARYEQFANAVAQHRNALCGLLQSLRAQNKTMAGYGAPAKGNTLLHYCGIGTDLLPYTVDKSSLKVGQYTPGMHIPVLPVSTLLERQPDYVLILAWNLAAEIMAQQQTYHDRGGKFIIPLPAPQIL
jgi:SAM-dependent methyltransferase